MPWPFIWTNLNPLYPRLFVPSLVEIGPVFLEKKLKMWKVYRRTGRQIDRQTTDNRRSEKVTLCFSSGELKSLKTSIDKIILFYRIFANRKYICHLYFSHSLSLYLSLSLFLSLLNNQMIMKWYVLSNLIFADIHLNN